MHNNKVNFNNLKTRRKTRRSFLWSFEFKILWRLPFRLLPLLQETDGMQRRRVNNIRCGQPMGMAFGKRSHAVLINEGVRYSMQRLSRRVHRYILSYILASGLGWFLWSLPPVHLHSPGLPFHPVRQNYALPVLGRWTFFIFFLGEQKATYAHPGWTGPFRVVSVGLSRLFELRPGLP